MARERTVSVATVDALDLALHRLRGFGALYLWAATGDEDATQGAEADIAALLEFVIGDAKQAIQQVNQRDQAEAAE